VFNCEGDISNRYESPVLKGSLPWYEISRDFSTSYYAPGIYDASSRPSKTGADVADLRIFAD